ncbi:MAG: InlB B-repeat-containing protein, partial [Thermoplasmata archaeon]
GMSSEGPEFDPGPTSGSSWVVNGTRLHFIATAHPGSRFEKYLTSGPGGFDGTVPSATANATAPFTELAVFTTYVAPPFPTFTLNVVSVGRPGGMPWQATVGALGASGTGGTLSIRGLNGSYLLTVPAVYASSGVRFFPSNGTSSPISISGNLTVSVEFETEFLLSVSSSSGGIASPGSEWVPAGGKATLQAVPATGFEFAYWNGTSGGYSGPNASAIVALDGPVLESATFLPVPSSVVQPTSARPSMSSNGPIDLAVVAGLFAVGVVLGVVAVRRREARPEVPGLAWDVSTEEAPSDRTPYAPGARPMGRDDWPSVGSEPGDPDGSDSAE